MNGRTVLFHIRVSEGKLEVVLRHMRRLHPDAHAAASGRRELLMLASLRHAGDAGRLARSLTDLESVESVACCAGLEPAQGAP